MARRSNTSAKALPANDQRVTLALQLADGMEIDVEASATALKFIGRYSRISAFGPLGTPLAAQIVTGH